MQWSNFKLIDYSSILILLDTCSSAEVVIPVPKCLVNKTHKDRMIASIKNKTQYETNKCNFTDK